LTLWGIPPDEKFRLIPRRISTIERVSMRLEGLPGFKQRLQAGENAWPSIGAGSVSRVIFGPLVVRYRYFGGLSFCPIEKVY
jgi:hypothetical protein